MPSKRRHHCTPRKWRLSRSNTVATAPDTADRAKGNDACVSARFSLDGTNGRDSGNLPRWSSVALKKSGTRSQGVTKTQQELQLQLQRRVGREVRTRGQSKSLLSAFRSLPHKDHALPHTTLDSLLLANCISLDWSWTDTLNASSRST